ncbi:mitogen-activated protein kinase kinase kinase 5-like [Typha angustifolia]|uniref:mitogen-activated protein kinase kinase kinase 5-like n=1 Tax=Typha angustifolia TaxID=59011 RepID=UPI003C304837
MFWWKSTNSSSPSSSSPSSSALGSPASPRRSRRDTFIGLRRTPRARLTRQDNLRHLDEIKVPGLPLDVGIGIISSVASTPASHSPNKLDPAPPRSSSSPVLLPQPLPLPEEAVASPHRDSGSAFGRPLPSPRGAFGAVECEDVYDASVDPSSSPVVSRLGPQSAPRSPERSDLLFNRHISSHYKKVFHDSIENVNFRLNIPAKSAPSSGFSSPVCSPRRLSNVDFFTSAMATQGVHWSAPDIPSTTMLTVSSPQASPEKFVASPEQSPRYNLALKSPAIRSRHLSAPPSPLHSNRFPDNSVGRHDSNGNVNVHPLPLPPGATSPMQSSFTHQSATKTEVSPVSGQWQKGKLIGSGTFGNVYEATNRHTGALCAMKEVNIIPDDSKSAESLKQLEQEIKFLSQFKHQNIVQYYGSEIIEDRFYIYLEYVHPGSINKYVRQHCGAMTESMIRNFTRHILNGLAYLHSKKIMHRDIKGANLLVDVNGVVKLADFGMAKHLSSAAPNLSLKGTPYWMAPEVVQATLTKDTGYDLAVDIWSLGCTIIEMFTGKHPWSGLEGAAAMFKVLHKDPPIPDTLSSEGNDFLQRCFRRNPSERPTATMLLEHPFIRNSHHHNLHGSIHAFAGIKLDAVYSQRDRKSSKSDSCVRGKQSYGVESSQSNPESSESASSRPSYRSNPEVPNLSPPHPNYVASSPAGSARSTSNGMHLANGTFHPCALPKPHGKEVLNL